MKDLLHKGRKFARIVRDPAYRRGLRFGVAAAVEHEAMLRSIDAATIIDVGANRGQFALAARARFPEARILSFEPLARPGAVYRRVFAGDTRATLVPVALGVSDGWAELHRSRRDDSSSLLPIGPLQRTVFPGTDEVTVEKVPVRRLDSVLRNESLAHTVLCKIDVQGTELDVLRGLGETIARIDLIMIELSFVPFYTGQSLFSDVDAALRGAQFTLDRLYAADVDSNGTTLQTNALYRK